MLIQIFKRILVAYLCFSLASCGGSGTGDDTKAQSGEALISIQTQKAESASTVLSDLISETEELNELLDSPDAIDETTGNRLLDYFNNSMIPALEETQETLEQLQTDEEAFIEFIEANGGSVDSITRNKLESRGWFIPIVGATIILGGIALSLGSFGLKTKARVKALEDKMTQSLNQGKSPAQAFGENSEDMWNTFGDHYIDLQTFIATSNHVVDKIKDQLGQCGKLIIETYDAYNNAQEINKNRHLIGKKKSGNSSKPGLARAVDDEPEIVYIGTSESSEFVNIPLGEWDFVVYEEGKVRDVLENVNVSSCSVATTHTVILPTLDQVLIDDSTLPIGDSGLSLSVSIPGYSISFDPFLVLASNNAASTGEIMVQNVLTISAFPDITSGLESMQIYIDPRQVSSSGTYSIGALNEVFIDQTAEATIAFVSNDITDADDGSPVAFNSTSGSIQFSSYGENDGDKLSGSFSAVISGDRITGFDNDGNRLRETISGTISGRFDLTVQ